MNKNAYEIRLDILKLAHDDLMGQYNHKISILQNEADRQQTAMDAEQVTALYPSTDDIIARAERLYRFVDTK